MFYFSDETKTSTQNSASDLQSSEDQTYCASGSSGSVFQETQRYEKKIFEVRSML